MGSESLFDADCGRAAWHRAGGENQFLRRQHGDSYTSNDHDGGPAWDELGLAADEECRFEIFRKDEQRMTSTLFSGGDWRWRLVTTGGLMLAEASGYPNEASCRAAVAVLQRRAQPLPGQTRLFGPPSRGTWNGTRAL